VATALNSQEMVWHNDGHSISLRLNKAELEIVVIACPGGESRACRYGDDECIVDYFIGRFGLDCNIGVCAPSEHLEICWSVSGDQNNPELAQVWFVPVDDEVFYAWMTTQTPSGQ